MGIKNNKSEADLAAGESSKILDGTIELGTPPSTSNVSLPSNEDFGLAFVDDTESELDFELELELIDKLATAPSMHRHDNHCICEQCKKNRGN
jgi:hypothetical protein